MQLPVPVKAVDYLPAAIAHASVDVEPCGVKEAALALMDLWAVFPLPANEAADAIWTETMAQYPADLVASAIKGLIKTRTWGKDAPLPGQVVALLKDEFEARVKHLKTLETMQHRVELDAAKTGTVRAGNHSAWEAKLSPAERETLESIRKARADGKSVADLIGGVKPMPIHPEERMNAETKARVRAERQGATA